MTLLINSPFEEIGKSIARIREQKGKEGTALAWIDDAFRLGQGFLVNLQFERILVYHHLIMQGDKKALPKMEAATLVAVKYIQENRLHEWESRAYRFLGRLYDYKGQFEKSLPAYKKALALSHLDPEYVEKGVPRWLELEGFLSNALIMSGKVKEGLASAKKTYLKYDSNSEAKSLKRKDYYTWAVWKSGIPIRTINALIDKKQLFDKKEMNAWLADAERAVNPPKSLKTWGDFSLRRDEIAALKKKLQEEN